MSNKPPIHEQAIQVIVNNMIAPLTRKLDSTGLYSGFWTFLGKRGVLNDTSGKGFGDYQAQVSDVIVCTFAKSGTYWMLQIAHQIAHKGQSEFDHMHDVAPWPDSGSLPSLALDNPQPIDNSPTDLRVIKTHYPFQNVPYSPNAKYITVIRDPKDVFVSSYHFVKGSIAGSLMPSVDTWFEQYLSPHFILGDWAEHTASYWAQRDKANLIILTFNDLKLNMNDYIKQVAQLMDVNLSNAEFDAVAEKSSFQYMKQHDNCFSPPVKPPWLKEGGKLVREGKSGISNQMLTKEQERKIDSYMQAELTRLGSDFPYTEMFDLA